MNIEQVTLHAKKRYCERCYPPWIYIVEKVERGVPLTQTERQNFYQIEREIIDIVTRKAYLVSGLNKNNKNKAKFEYRGLTYIVHFNCRKGKVVTITWSKLY
jgi:hypothetical protein